eukprot:scaffold112345_cov60-Phaeocystis_antarctica.AAC.4
MACSASIAASDFVEAAVAFNPAAISSSMRSRVHLGKKWYGSIFEISNWAGDSNVMSSTVASSSWFGVVVPRRLKQHSRM